ncbi:MAG: NUDIX hydrolase [bacterium]
MKQVLSAVKALILNNNKFLIVKQLVKGEEVWDLPGGKVEYEESPYAALLREVKEETDLDIEIGEPAGVWYFFKITDGQQIVCSTFFCKLKNGKNINLTKNVATENINEYRWVSKKEFFEGEYRVGHESLRDLIEHSNIC